MQWTNSGYFGSPGPNTIDDIIAWLNNNFNTSVFNNTMHLQQINDALLNLPAYSGSYLTQPGFNIIGGQPLGINYGGQLCYDCL